MILKNILFSTAALALTIIVAELSSIDLRFQQLLFIASENRWLWLSTDSLLRLLFYSGPKILLILFAFALLLMLLFHNCLAWPDVYVKGMLIVVFSMMAVPLVVSGLKTATNIACPKNLIAYGGSIPYSNLLESYPDNKTIPDQRCFPAAHASGGFSLLSLFFLFQSSRHRKKAVVFALTVGWAMGAYKMLIGDHFLSHTLVSMELSWLLVCLIAGLANRFYRPKKLAAAQMRR